MRPTVRPPVIAKQACVLVSLLLIGPFSAPGLVLGQDTPSILRGQVLHANEPLGEGKVLLHRVSAESAGETDSVQVDGEGRFSFVLPDPPDPENQSEVYFASLRFQGILYFGEAITDPAQLDDLYRITVYDTVHAPTQGRSFPVGVRNVFLEGVADGWQVTDLFEIRNESSQTVVTGGGAVWSYPLPPGATDFTLGQGDLPPDAVDFSGGRIQVSAPVPPGDRLYVLRYRVASLDLTFPLPGKTRRIEVLIKEPAPPLELSGLDPVETIALEPGSSYRRYAGADLEDAVVELVTVDEPARIPFEWLAVILALTLGGAGIAAVKRAPLTTRPSTPITREAILLEIARLDESIAGHEDLASVQEAYHRQRSDLLTMLHDDPRTIG